MDSQNEVISQNLNDNVKIEEENDDEDRNRALQDVRERRLNIEEILKEEDFCSNAFSQVDFLNAKAIVCPPPSSSSSQLFPPADIKTEDQTEDRNWVGNFVRGVKNEISDWREAVHEQTILMPDNNDYQNDSDNIQRGEILDYIMQVDSLVNAQAHEDPFISRFGRGDFEDRTAETPPQEEPSRVLPIIPMDETSSFPFGILGDHINIDTGDPEIDASELFKFDGDRDRADHWLQYDSFHQQIHYRPQHVQSTIRSMRNKLKMRYNRKILEKFVPVCRQMVESEAQSRRDVFRRERRESEDGSDPYDLNFFPRHMMNRGPSIIDFVDVMTPCPCPTRLLTDPPLSARPSPRIIDVVRPTDSVDFSVLNTKTEIPEDRPSVGRGRGRKPVEKDFAALGLLSPEEETSLTPIQAQIKDLWEKMQATLNEVQQKSSFSIYVWFVMSRRRELVGMNVASKDCMKVAGREWEILRQIIVPKPGIRTLVLAEDPSYSVPLKMASPESAEAEFLRTGETTSEIIGDEISDEVFKRKSKKNLVIEVSVVEVLELLSKWVEEINKFIDSHSEKDVRDFKALVSQDQRTPFANHFVTK